MFGIPMFQFGLLAIALLFIMVAGLLGGRVASAYAPEKAPKRAYLLSTIPFDVSVILVLLSMAAHDDAFVNIALVVTFINTTLIAWKIYINIPKDVLLEGAK